MLTINACEKDNGIPFVATYLDKHGYPEFYFIKCYKCGNVSSMEYEEDEAIKQWNTNNKRDS
jgi:hypothetical protein